MNIDTKKTRPVYMLLILAIIFLIVYFYIEFFIMNIRFIETYDVSVNATLFGFKINSDSLSWDFFYLDLYIIILGFMLFYVIFLNHKKVNIKPRHGLYFMIICLLISTILNFISISNTDGYAVYSFFDVQLIVPENLKNGLTTTMINMGVILSILFSLYFLLVDKKNSSINGIK